MGADLTNVQGPLGETNPGLDVRLRAALESTSDNVVLLDREFRVVFVNRRATELNGVSPHHYDGLLMWDAWPSSAGHPVEPAIRKAMETGEPMRLVHNHAEKGGLDLWLEIDAYPSEDGLSIFFRDVTQRRLDVDLLRATADAAQGYIAYLDKDLIYRFCNRRYEEWFGVAVEGIVGRHLREVVGDDVYRRLLPHFDRALAGHDVRFEGWIDYEDRGLRYMRVAYSPRIGPSGKVEGIHAQVFDDSESRRAQESLLISEESLRQTQQSLSLAMKGSRMGWWSRDLVTDEIIWSPELEAILGLEPGGLESSEERFLEAVHPDDRDRVVESVEGALDAHTEYNVEFRFHRPDGSEGWMEGRGRATYGPDGPLALFGIGIDVTERRAMDERLRESEGRLNLALRAASLGTWDTDVESGVTRYSADAAPLFGKPYGEFTLALDEWSTFVHPEDMPRLVEEFERLVHEDVPYQVVFRLIDSRGDLHWVEINGLAERDCAGRAIRAIGVFSDVTDQREAEAALERRVQERTAQLEASRRSQESWNYSVSHDLRAPLRAVMSTARILQMDHAEELSPAAQDLLDRQANAAKKLGNLIDELLQASRLASQDLLLEPLDITEIAREAVEEQAAHWNKPFDVRIEAGMRGTGDPRLVKLVLVNYVENAMKYSPADTRIEVGRMGNAFFVRDQGIGFEMQYEPKLWRPFERLVRDSDYPGTGIGLYNVAAMVERMGGRVWAESEPGKGSTFFFTLS